MQCTAPKKVYFQSSGLLQKSSISENSHPRVMCGVLESPCGKYLSLAKVSILCDLILTLSVPYPTLTNDEAVAKVMKGYRLPAPDTCPEEVYKLMLQCWSVNPDERPNFKSIHETLLNVLRYIRGEEEEGTKYASEDADKNYTYNNNIRTEASGKDTYNNDKATTYNTNDKTHVYNFFGTDS